MENLPVVSEHPAEEVIVLSPMIGGVYGTIDEVVYKGKHYVRKHMHGLTSPIINEVYLRSTYYHEYMIKTHYIFLSIDNEVLSCSALMDLCAPINRYMKDKARVISQLLTVLAFLQSNDIIHGDIKPDNILYSTSEDMIKLIDFGIIHNVRDITNSPSQTIVPIDQMIFRHAEYREKFPRVLPQSPLQTQLRSAMFATGITILWILGIANDTIFDTTYNLEINGRKWLMNKLSAIDATQYYEMLVKMIYEGDCSYADFVVPSPGYVRPYIHRQKNCVCNFFDAERLKSSLSLTREEINRASLLYSSFVSSNDNKIALIACISLCGNNQLLADYLMDVVSNLDICERAEIVEYVYEMMLSSVYTLPKWIVRSAR